MSYLVASRLIQLGVYTVCSSLILGWCSSLYAQNIDLPIRDLGLYQQLDTSMVDNFLKALEEASARNSQTIHNQNERKKYVIRNFCDTMLTDLVGEGFQYGPIFIIDPKQSYFLYYLCVGIDTMYLDYFPKLKDLTISQSGRDQALNIKKKDPCHTLDPNLGDCSIHRIVTALIYAVLDDLYRTKYATIQLYQGPLLKPEDVIKSYARRFWTHDLFALADKGGYCNHRSYHYLYPEALTDHKSWFCSHPKTFKELKSKSKNAGSLVKKNKVIRADTEHMYLSDIYDADPAESDYAKFCNIYSYPQAPDTTIRERNLLYHVIKCAFIIHHHQANKGLSEHQTVQGALQAFYNAEYNELLMYRLFVAYYLSIAETNNQFGQQSPRYQGSYRRTSKEVSDELSQLDNDLSTLKNNQIQRHTSLGDFWMSFHLGIAHRIYQEDLSVFNKQYALVITQVNQIRSKLYKAQERKR